MIDAQEGTDCLIPTDQHKGWGPVQEEATHRFASVYEPGIGVEAMDDAATLQERIERFWNQLEVDGRFSRSGKDDWR